MIRAASFSPPPFSPVPPPPPSPASPPRTSRPPLSRQRPSKRAVFDIVSTSPQSFNAEEKTLLKARLDRSRELKVAVKRGVPARLLTQEELTSSSSGNELGEGSSSKGTKADGSRTKERDSSSSHSSPWLTDSDPPSRHTSPPIAPSRPPLSTGKTAQPRMKTVEPRVKSTARPDIIKIEGFEINSKPTTTTAPTSVQRSPTPARSVSPTSTLSLLFSRDKQDRPVPVPPRTGPLDPLNTTLPIPRRNWNADVVGAALSNRSSDSPISPRVFRERAPSSPNLQGPPRSSNTFPLPSASLPKARVNPSTSLPSLDTSSAVVGSTKKARFFTPSHSLTATPTSSPPISPIMSSNDPRALSLNFSRRPGFTRTGSGGESWTKMCQVQKERERKATRSRSRSLLREGSVGLGKDSTETEREMTDTEVEEKSDCEELVQDCFQTSVFASNYSNSATSLSSASSSIIRSSSTASISPKSTLVPSSLSPAAFSVPTPTISPSDQNGQRRISSDPAQPVDLKTLRRQQLERKKMEDLESESSEDVAPTPHPIQVSKSTAPRSTQTAAMAALSKKAEVASRQTTKPVAASGMRKLFSFN